MADKYTAHLLLGIDGGGTKTEFLLTDLNGREIKRVILGGSNPVNAGIESTCAVLEKGIMQICEGFDIGKISVFAGIAGLKAGENQKLINDFLSRFGFASHGCGSDIDLALEVALNGKNGTVVIMGTGVVAYTRSDEKLYRTGGRGYMIDKGGSGFHFGSDALNSAFEFIDGRGGSETVLKLVEKRLGKKLEASVAEIYSGGVAYVASFAPAVFEAYGLGDSEALKIIDRNAHEAAKIINGVRKPLRNSYDKIVVCGGLCKQKDILYSFLMKYIEGEVSLTFLDEPMVNGAISLAARSAEKC
ncbi:MAG: hypothetical protein IJE74_08965 [Clostridia bacterium]|nr:hypothetical protein [Clostridia bacterium]